MNGVKRLGRWQEKKDCSEGEEEGKDSSEVRFLMISERMDGHHGSGRSRIWEEGILIVKYSYVA